MLVGHDDLVDIVFKTLGVARVELLGHKPEQLDEFLATELLLVIGLLLVAYSQILCAGAPHSVIQVQVVVHFVLIPDETLLD